VLPPCAELSVEDDLVVGTVAWDSLEESDVRKLAFDRRRSSLKNGILLAAKTVRLNVSGRELEGWRPLLDVL
jgi:hypothetical protein